MNYKIKSKTGTITIGGDLITETPIDLVSLTETSADNNSGDLWNKISTGDLIVELNQNELNKKDGSISFGRVVTSKTYNSITRCDLLNSDLGL